MRVLVDGVVEGGQNLRGAKLGHPEPGFQNEGRLFGRVLGKVHKALLGFLEFVRGDVAVDPGVGGRPVGGVEFESRPLHLATVAKCGL